MPVKLAVAQFPVSGDVARNAGFIRRQIVKAAANGASVVQFPETALSGYPPKHWSGPDSDLDRYPAPAQFWQRLQTETARICELAAQHNIWVVLGSMRPIADALPASCLHVVSDQGEIVASYDKQRLYGKEKDYFSQGDEPCVVVINGHKCGFLVCYDNCFPELFDEYRNAGVGLLFHSFFNAQNSRATSIKDLMLANLLVRAADNGLWICASNSCTPYSPLSACIVRPDGSSVRSRRHVTSLVFDNYPNAELGWTYDNRVNSPTGTRV